MEEVQSEVELAAANAEETPSSLQKKLDLLVEERKKVKEEYQKEAEEQATVVGEVFIAFYFLI